MSFEKPAGASQNRRPNGRPRLLTLRQIIDAGIAIGLQDLSISTVASRLGVGMGTIYTHVESREELFRLVAAVMVERPVLEEAQQHWSDVLRTHAAHTFSIFGHEPELTAQIISGAVDPKDAFPEVENVLSLLISRGFSVDQAFELYVSCNQIVIGAAIAAVTLRSRERRGVPRRLSVARAFLEYPPDRFPNLRSFAAAYADEDRLTDYSKTLERLIAQVAAQRGEVLPEAAGGR